MYNINYLEHHGIKGMRWGVRRFQKKDGSLTSAGKKRYSTDEEAKRARRRKIAKRVAIGAGVALGVAGTAYAVKRAKDIRAYGNMLKKQAADDDAKQAKADHKAARAKEQAEYLRNMASRTSAKNTSRNPGDKPYKDNDELFKKRMVESHRRQLEQRMAKPPKKFSTPPSTSSPRRSKTSSLTLTGIEDYTEELLRRNKSRLNKAGY